MAKMNMYTVFDTAAGQAGPPFIAKNDTVAFRQYRGLLQQVSAGFQGDYKLAQIGEWDDEAGSITAFPEPIYMDMPIPQLELPIGGKK